MPTAGDRPGVAGALRSLGRLALDEGRHAKAHSLLEACLRIEREVGHRPGLPWTLSYLSWLAIFERNYTQATDLIEEGMAVCRELEDHEGIGRLSFSQGHLALDRGDGPGARTRFAESATIFVELGYKYGLAYALEGLAVALGLFFLLQRNDGIVLRALAHVTFLTYFAGAGFAASPRSPSISSSCSSAAMASYCVSSMSSVMLSSFLGPDGLPS